MILIVIEKQVKTKYFDTKTRFVDLTDVTTTQATFNKMFGSVDDPTSVESVSFDPAINLATCTCNNHRFNSHEVVEFKSNTITNGEQFRVIDVIDSNTFTFAYFDEFAIDPSLTAKIAGAGWIGADGAYTSVAGLQILVDFETLRTDFLLFGAHQEVYYGSQYMTISKMRFFIDDIGFYNIHSTGINLFNRLGFVYGMSRYGSSDYGLDHTPLTNTYGLWSGESTAQRLLANYDTGRPTSRSGDLLLQHPLIVTAANGQTTVETPILFAARGACIDNTVTVDGLQYILVSDGVSPFYVCISNWDRENV